MIYAYGYIRVSGAAQVEKDGPERQREAIETFCKQHSNALQLEDVYFEKAVSGTVEVMDRPEFAQMIDVITQVRVIEPGVPVCIVVERMDRLARDLMVCELMIRVCKKLGISVYSTDQGALIDMAGDADLDPMRKAIRQIIAVLAELEKSMTVKKLKAARDRKKAATGRCEGSFPFGHYPQEQSTAKLIVAMYGEGKSLAQTARLLNEEGLLRRNGGEWTKQHVQSFLRTQKNRGKVVVKRALLKEDNHDEHSHVLRRDSGDAGTSGNHSTLGAELVQARLATANVDAEGRPGAPAL